MLKKNPIWLFFVFLELSGMAASAQYSLLPEKPVPGGNITKDWAKTSSSWGRIRLQTLDGKSYTLSGLHKKLSAIVFFSPECPLCQNYTLVLNKLQTRFDKDLDIAGIFPGKSYQPTACKSFRDKYHIRFPLFIDGQKDLVKLLGGRITPEVFLLDKKRNVLYHGAIDNWVTALGKQRTRATENYLEDAVADYLNGESVRIKEVKAIGCFINDH